MSNIKIEQLSFGFDTQTHLLFDRADLVIDTHWKLGLIGRNGRGKTTLLKLLQGQLPYSGTISHQQAFVYFPQTVVEPQRLTFEILQDLWDFEQWQLERELNLLQLDPEVLWRPFDSLSGGEQTKVLLALLFIDEEHFPLIDEPTNHLDITARAHVAAYLKRKKGFIVVSHDRNFVDEVVDHILSIEKSRLVIYQGNFSVYEEQKQRQDQYELEQNVKLKKEIGRLKQTAAEKAEWSRGRERDKLGSPTKKGSGAIYDTGAIGARAARTMKRSKAIVKRMEDQVQNKEQLLKDIEYIDPLSMNAQPTHHKVLLRTEKLQLAYDQPLFEPLNMTIEAHDRIGIRGANGSGKSSLVASLFGQFPGTVTGSVWMPQNLSISYVRQNYEDNRGTLQEFAKLHQLDYQELLNNLKKLGVERNVFQTRIEEMSMGQRKRVELAKSLATPAELFIWDEPLNYLDVFNQNQLAEVIQLVQPTMLIIEHDQRFLEQVTTKQLILKQPNTGNA
jgi:lincosamide and streptogramin A transport system ATP-binding/permease protein